MSGPPSSPVSRAGVPLAVIVAIACVAQFMVVLDTSIVNVALPDMRADLGLSVTAQQWVVDGYLITFGGLLLLAARASDLFGRRWVFQAGLAVFTLGSIAGGVAGSDAVLLAARCVQGIGAAALAPASLSLITASHADPHARTRALTIWSIAGASAGAAGMVLGGLLTEALSWRWVFFVNVPIGAALIGATAAYLVGGRPEGARPRLDVPGALTVTLGVGALIYGISEATSAGWGSAEVLIALAAAAILLVAFVAVERRSAAPLVPFAIFAHRNLRTANALMALMGVTLTATLFFLSLYLQQVLGESALRAGLSLVPMTITLMLGSFASKSLIPVVGPRVLLVGGGLIAAAGLAWLSRLPDESAYVVHVLGPTLVTGLGMSVMILPITVAATTGVSPRDAGLASGLLNMGRQIGGALGLAALVTISSSVTKHSGIADPDAALVHGFRTSLLIAAGVSLVAALAATTLRDAPHVAPDPEPAAAAEAQA